MILEQLNSLLEQLTRLIASDDDAEGREVAQALASLLDSLSPDQDEFSISLLYSPPHFLPFADPYRRGRKKAAGARFGHTVAGKCLLQP